MEGVRGVSAVHPYRPLCPTFLGKNNSSVTASTLSRPRVCEYLINFGEIVEDRGTQKLKTSGLVHDAETRSFLPQTNVFIIIKRLCFGVLVGFASCVGGSSEIFSRKIKKEDN